MAGLQQGPSRRRTRAVRCAAICAYGIGADMSQMIESFLQPAAAAALRAQSVQLQEAAAESVGPALVPDTHPLRGVKLKLQARVGECAMTISELMGARENQVLVLD